MSVDSSENGDAMGVLLPVLGKAIICRRILYFYVSVIVTTCTYVLQAESVPDPYIKTFVLELFTQFKTYRNLGMLTASLWA